jgi:hypothetical protein
MRMGVDQQAAGRRERRHRRARLRETDRLVVVGDRTVDVALGAPQQAAARIRERQVGIEPDRGVGVGDCAVEIAGGAPGDTPVLIGERALGIEADRLAVVGDRLPVIALLPISIAAIVEDDRARRLHADRVIEIRNRDVVLAFVVIGRAAHVVGGGAALELQRGGEIRDRARVVVLAVGMHRAPEIDRREIVAGEAAGVDEASARRQRLVGRGLLAGAERAVIGGRNRRSARRDCHEQCKPEDGDADQQLLPDLMPTAIGRYRSNQGSGDLWVCRRRLPDQVVGKLSGGRCRVAKTRCSGVRHKPDLTYASCPPSRLPVGTARTRAQFLG